MSDQAVEQVAVPPASDALAQALQKLILAVIANHKAFSGVAAISADVLAAVQDMAGPLGQMGLLESELKMDPVGVAEAMAVAGFGVVKALRSA